MAGMVIEAFEPLRKGTSLRGFARVRTPGGLIFHDVAIHKARENGHAWAAPASKPRLTRDGTQQRDANGKALFSPVVTFASRELRDRFSDAVVAAVEAAHPGALHTDDVGNDRSQAGRAAGLTEVTVSGTHRF